VSDDEQERLLHGVRRQWTLKLREATVVRTRGTKTFSTEAIVETMILSHILW